MVKRRTLNDEGALEGLPLYLIILVVIAGVGTAIIVGWMMSAKSTELDRIEVKGGTLISDQKEKINITAYDQSGNPLKGVTVSIKGCGVDDVGQTNENGYIVFDVSKPLHLPDSQTYGTIDVTAEYTGDITTTDTETITVEHP